MYVCLCNNIREQDLRRVVQSGPVDVIDAYEHLGATPCCGQCLSVAENLLKEFARVGGDQSAGAL